MLVFNLSIFFFCIVFISDGISWSTWTLCSSQENCYQKSLLKCVKGKGIQCAPAQRNDYTYQKTISSDCNKTCDAHGTQVWKKVPGVTTKKI